MKSTGRRSLFHLLALMLVLIGLSFTACSKEDAIEDGENQAPGNQTTNEHTNHQEEPTPESFNPGTPPSWATTISPDLSRNSYRQATGEIAFWQYAIFEVRKGGAAQQDERPSFHWG